MSYDPTPWGPMGWGSSGVWEIIRQSNTNTSINARSQNGAIWGNCRLAGTRTGVSSDVVDGGGAERSWDSGDVVAMVLANLRQYQPYTSIKPLPPIVTTSTRYA